MKTIAEIRAALVDLLAQIDDDANYSIFDYYGQQFRIPKGWRMVRECGNYTLIDADNVGFGKLSKTADGQSWVYVDRNSGDAQYTVTLLGALRRLIDSAWVSHDKAS